MPVDVHPLEAILRERIVVLDGAMGTMIQRRKLSEQDYRGKRFRDWKGKDLKGCLELLNLTQPQVVEEIHTEYLDAGADDRPSRSQPCYKTNGRSPFRWRVDRSPSRHGFHLAGRKRFRISRRYVRSTAPGLFRADQRAGGSKCRSSTNRNNL